MILGLALESVTAILLAAGKSTRMGKLKSLLTWGEYTLIEYQVNSLLNSKIDQVIVVLGHRNQELTNYIDKFPINIVVNEDYTLGKSTSIKKGMNSVSNNESDFLFLSVDQPRKPELIDSLIDFHFQNKSLISYPIYNNRGGHPIIFNRAFKTEIENINECTFGLKNIITNNSEKVKRLELYNNQCLIDLNIYEDYKRVRDEYFKY